MLLTPSGRFETNTKICLSFSAFHPELWQPAWGIRLILEALISFLPTPADGAIGALDWSSAERKRLAKKSQEWCCKTCGKAKDLLPELKKEASSSSNRFQKEIEELQRLQMQEHLKEEEEEAANLKEEGVEEDTKMKAQTVDSPSESADRPLSTNDLKDLEKKEMDIEPDDDDFKDLEDDEFDIEPEKVPKSESAKEQKLKRKSSSNVSKTEEEDSKPAAAVQEEAPVEARQVIEATVEAESTGDSSRLVDPILQVIILILSIICYLLLRKVQALIDDLRALD